MKHLLKFIIILIANYSFSQTIIPIENRKTTTEVTGQTYYYKDVNGVFDKFLGNWKYQDTPANPTKIVEITFYKREMILSGMGGYYDQIYARIKYTKDGVIVYDTFPANIPALMTRDYNIFGGSFREPTNTNKLKLGYYSEPGLGGKSGQLLLEYFPNGGSPILKWQVQSFRSSVYPFKLPTTMVLNRP
jgi:hypothetical protein